MTAGQLSIDLPAVAANCYRCASRFQDDIVALRGIDSVEVDARSRKVTITYEPEKVDLETIDRVGTNAEAKLERTYRHAIYQLRGMDCEDCAATIGASVKRLPGVSGTDVNFIATTLRVEFDEPSARDEDVISMVRDLGYQAVVGAARAEPAADRPSIWRFFARDEHARTTLAAITLLAVGWSLAFAPSLGWLWRAILAVAIVVGGWPIALRGIRAIRYARSLDMNLLMTIAVLGAAAIDQWIEAALVVVLFSVGEALETYSMDRARISIRALVNRAPAQARVLHGDHEHLQPATEVKVGDRIAVQPGERIPADGRVVTGITAVNEAPITGESALAPKEPKDQVYAGTVNDAGFFEMIAERPGADTTLARIIRMVEEAQARRAPIQRFVDRFARVYTPIIVTVAVSVALVPPLGFGQPFGDWFLRALVLLVIACPCALVISTPVAIAAALSSATSNGVLIKGGAFLEALGKVRTIAFDKTGTLTRGMPAVTEVVPFGGESEAEVLRYAAALERRSEHPLARAIRRAAETTGLSGQLPEATDLEIAAGRGISGTVLGHAISVGSPAFLGDESVDIASARSDIRRLSASGHTPIMLARDGQLIGLIATADEVREEARPTLQALEQSGVQHRVMLTGDRDGTAAAVASDMAISDFHAELLPEDKVAIIRDLARSDGPVAMVGDGINDAPALAAADIGIAMGVAGTDTALETADVALMGDDLRRLPEVVALGRRTMRTVRLNVTFSLTTKAVFIVLAVAGLSTLWMAVLADVGASVAVTVFGLRLVRHRWHSHKVTKAHTRHAR